MEHLTEYLLFGLYLIAGPVMSVLFGIALIKGRKRMLLVNRPAAALPGDPPHVTILIPARDEAQRIGDCVRSALGQDYPHLDVLAIDDRSSDGTGQVLDEMAEADGRLEVIHIGSQDPPEGWTGKCHALHLAMEHAEGRWLLFVDSDVVLEPDALSATLAFALNRDADLVSLLLRLECHSFWERLLIPLAGCALNLMHFAALTNNDHLRRAAFANGQYMLFRRRVYEAVGGHEAVCDRLCEDIALAQRVKAAGYRVRIAWGAHLAAVRMYSSLPAIQRGWARIFSTADVGSLWRIFVAIAVVLLCCCSAYAAGAWGIYRIGHPVNAFGGWGWLAAATVHLGLLTSLLGTMYTWSGNRRGNALLLPLGAAMLLAIFARSLLMCLTGKVEWRGTSYTRQRGVVASTADPVQASG